MTAAKMDPLEPRMHTVCRELSREALAVATILQAEVIMAPGKENHLLRAALGQVGLGQQQSEPLHL